MYEPKLSDFAPGAVKAFEFYNDWLDPRRGGFLYGLTKNEIKSRLGPSAGTNPTPAATSSAPGKYYDRWAFDLSGDYDKLETPEEKDALYESRTMGAPLSAALQAKTGFNAQGVRPVQPTQIYKDAIVPPAAAPAPQASLENLGAMTPSQTGSGKTALQAIEQLFSASTAENRKKINELEQQVNKMPNPYDTSRPEFARALAGAANRVASVMGQRSAQDIRQMAGAGMLGSAKAAAIKYNQEESARRAQASAQEGLYAQAMQGYNAFEQKRLSDLAALRGQAFRDEMQGIGAIGNSAREALTLDLDIRAKNIANDLAGIQLDDTRQTTDERRALIKGELKSKLDMLPIQNEATRAALETAVAQNKLDAEQIGVLQGISDRYGPGALMAFLQAMNFVKGFVNSAGSSFATGAKMMAGGA